MPLPQSSPRRFRFGQRSLFVLATLTAVGTAIASAFPRVAFVLAMLALGAMLGRLTGELIGRDKYSVAMLGMLVALLVVMYLAAPHR